MLMFGKFCRHLEACGVSVPNARTEDVRSFFAGPLGESSTETVKRYTRLIERIYDDMRNRNLIKGNPVTNWITQRAFEPPIEHPKPIKQAHFVASPAEVSQLQEWLYAHGRRAAYTNEWRLLRDTAIASLSLGAGLRCFELIVLSKSQVKYAPRASASDMFEFDIPSRATVRTAKAHETNAEEMCAHLMELWWQMRWEGIRHSDESRPKTVIPGDRVFPSDLKGSQLQRSTLYKALKAISMEAMTAGAVNERTEWMLTNGARGLRRAYVLSELAKGGNPHDISRRLGHHDKTSMRAYTGTVKAMSFS
ncbi:hypothetical protein CBP36_20000 (plasmid) [Acidovorax carolinensis]|uniref:Tyr recombinase domain-containing protein n=2 Tax=Acidovorax carolinensis TaxID=553814 RepID=A0A240UJM4_9BURK|nr:hypothetical protein CBP35_19975 [Acidovorax carolinensis]ART61252.1 hypothetical protein CBP36_20000 [Acidovorax carolinensis]